MGRSQSGSFSFWPCAGASRVTSLLIGLMAVTIGASRARGQNSQPFSIQASGIYADLFGDQFPTLKAGVGFEGQLRYTRGARSIGAGFQYTVHGDSEAEADGHDANIKLIGMFVEPRYVINTGSGRAAPYLSARLALARFDVRVNFSDGDVLTFNSNGVTLNGGGGVLVSLTPRVNLDAGATIGFSKYNDTVGDISGKPFDMQMGSGTNIVARIGLAIGIGK
jgi:hypothetical protein